MSYWILALVAWATIGPLSPPQTRDNAGMQRADQASIAGVVVDHTTPGQPVRRAIVSLSGPALSHWRSTTTDDDGRFRFTSLPAGAFTITVARASFVTSAYGARRPGRPGTPVNLAASQNITGIVVRLWPGATLSGTLRDELGQPIAGVAMTAISDRKVVTPILTLSNNGVVTSELGEFRIFGLEPGRYVLKATPQARAGGPIVGMPGNQIDAILAALSRRAGTAEAGTLAGGTSQTFDVTPVYFPGTPGLDQATPIALEAGEHRGGLDFTLVRVPVAVVSGRVADSNGAPAAGASIQLTSLQNRSLASVAPPIRRTSVAADGTFRIAQVPPGEYRLIARSKTVANEPSTWSSAPVSVFGSDLKGLSLQLDRGVTLRGRVVFPDEGTPAPADLSKLSVNLLPPWISSLRPGTVVSDLTFRPPASVSADGTFELAGVFPGLYRFDVTGPGIGATWLPKSALLGNQDLFDAPVEIALTGGAATTLEAVFTSRKAELSGTVTSASGAPFQEIFVIAFPVDEHFWISGSRRVQAVRPGADGRFSFETLPPGDYWVGAVSDIDQGDWEDSSLLKELSAQALRVSLEEGQKKTLNLRAGGGS